MSNQEPGTDAALATIDQELALVASAIAMVASGEADAVSVGGLHLGEQLIRPARRMAFGRGVRIVPLWTPDDSSAAIRAERLGDD